MCELSVTGDDRPRVLVIVGPTGSGKTALGIHLARHFGAEIVGADSRQVYRCLDIGTAKPTAEEQSAARHHLVDVADPDEEFTAADYTALARAAIADIAARGARVLVVGGTGLYVRSLLGGLFPAPPKDEVLRRSLRRAAEEKGVDWLHGELARVDPETAALLHPNDVYRVVRALEVFRLTGRAIARWRAEHAFADQPYRTRFIGLAWPRDTLYRRIAQRVDAMWEAGLVEEVQGLLARGYDASLKPLQSVGYREVIEALEGRHTMAEARAETAKQTRRLAKRQLTWFHKENVEWLPAESAETAAMERADMFWG